MPELKQLKGDVLITCKSCKKRYPMRELRYDKKGEDLVCKECFSSSKNTGDIVQDIKKIDPAKLEPTGPRSRDALAMVKYYCIACRFKFTRKQEFHFENCPSCGKLGAIKKDVPLTSSQLLEEAGDYFN